MASSYKDSSPSMGAKKAPAEHKADFRDPTLKGSGVKATFKAVGVEPNEGAPELKKNPGHVD